MSLPLIVLAAASIYVAYFVIHITANKPLHPEDDLIILILAVFWPATLVVFLTILVFEAVLKAYKNKYNDPDRRK